MRSLFNPMSLVLFALPACDKDEDPPFLPISELCHAYAEEVCAAQADCCDAADSTAACEPRVFEECNEERDQLTGENALRYDGEGASDKLDELRAKVDACEQPGPTSRFFLGAQTRGEACERDSQCASFRCEDKACVAAEARPLCSF